MVRTCEEEGGRAHAKKKVRCTGTRRETERKTENQVERLSKQRYGKSGADSGVCNGQDKVEERNAKLFWRPQIMGKAREEKYI